jgi:hypothetical protein
VRTQTWPSREAHSGGCPPRVPIPRGLIQRRTLCLLLWRVQISARNESNWADGSGIGSGPSGRTSPIEALSIQGRNITATGPDGGIESGAVFSGSAALSRTAMSWTGHPGALQSIGTALCRSETLNRAEPSLSKGHFVVQRRAIGLARDGPRGRQFFDLWGISLGPCGRPTKTENVECFVRLFECSP